MVEYFDPAADSSCESEQDARFQGTADY